MLEPIQFERGLSPVAVFVTVFVHCLTLLFLTLRPEPQLLQPTATLRGDGGNTITHFVLVAPGSSVLDSAIAKTKETDHALEARRRKKPDHASLEPKPAV